MDRRPQLAAVVLIVLAGCLGSGGTDATTPGVANLEMTPTNETGIARAVTDSANRLGSAGSVERRILEDLVANGSATVERRDPPLRERRPLIYEGAVYRLSYRTTETRTAFEYSVSMHPVETTPDANETVEFEALPGVDRGKFAALGFTETAPVGIATTFRYTRRGRNRSALVPAPKRPVVVWGPGERARVSVERSGTVTLSTYRYTAERIADSARAYGSQVRETHAFSLSALSADQRRIVGRVIEGGTGYVGDLHETPPPGLSPLIERIRSHDPLVTTTKGPGTTEVYVVRYDGRIYLTRLVLAARR